MNEPESQQLETHVPVRSGSPFVPEPEEPRLGIIHLLAWTAGVAVYLSFFRTVVESGRAGLSATNKAMWVINGFAGGAALAGLGLFVVRRWRGIVFPKHPGEYLLLLVGIQALSGFVFQIYWFLIRGEDNAFETTRIALIVWSTVMTVIGVTIYLIAARRIKVRRWKVFFVASILASLLGWLTECASLLTNFSVYGFLQVIGLAVNFLLLVVVLKDAFQRKRYPWPHFLGIGLRFWQVGLNLVWYAIVSWFPELL